MRHYIWFGCLVLLLSACQPLSNRPPKVINNCDYASLTGPRVRLATLPPEQQATGYSRLYAWASRFSDNLPYAIYHQQEGKLTDQVVVRDYDSSWAMGPRLWRCHPRWGCDLPDRFMMMPIESPAERALRLSRTRWLFQQVMLKNCQLVYIHLDTLNSQPLSKAALAELGVERID